MVIGWDGLLPDWWSDLHPRFRTPAKALAVVTGACIIVALVSSWGGAGGQEIYQIGTGGAVACYAFITRCCFPWWSSEGFGSLCDWLASADSW